MLFVGVLVPSQGEARRQVWGAVCAQRMQEWSSALISYSFDNRDALPTFTWRAGQPGVPGAGVGEPKANLRAVQAQSLAMVRKFAGRDDITAPDDWLPQPHFTWLVLHEAGHRNVLKTVKCPEDRRGSLVELNWQRQGGPAPSISEFASTFEFVPATWSPNATLIYSDGKVLPIVEPGPREGEYRVPEGRPFGLKPRRTDEVAFPDRKVILFDPFDRHSASKKRHYAHLSTCMACAWSPPKLVRATDRVVAMPRSSTCWSTRPADGVSGCSLHTGRGRAAARPWVVAVGDDVEAERARVQSPRSKRLLQRRRHRGIFDGGCCVRDGATSVIAGHVEEPASGLLQPLWVASVPCCAASCLSSRTNRARARSDAARGSTCALR